MGKVIVAQQRRAAWNVIIVQAVTVILLAFGLLVGWGKMAGGSALIGGLCWLLPCMLFAWRVFIDMRPSDINRIIARFYAAEVLKLVASGVLVVVVIRYLPLSFPAFLAGYVAALFGFCLAPFLQFYLKKSL